MQAALIFALMAQVIAYWVAREVNLVPGRGVALWVMSIPPIFVLVQPLTILVILAALMVVMAPPQASHRVAFFIFAVPCVPVTVNAFLPFPGINFLALLSQQRVAAVTILLPILLLTRSAERPGKGWAIADFCVIGYAIYTATMVGQVTNFTSGLRFLVEQVVTFVVPYIAIVRAIETQEDLELCFKAFLGCSIILASIALIATVKQWDFYRVIEPPSVMGIPDYRAGLLRISATANTHSLGFHLAAGLLVLEHLKHRLSPGMLRLMALRGLLFGGVLVTGSRGALVALIVAFGVYVLVTIRKAAIRRLYLLMFGLAGVAGTIWLLVANPSEVDPYGTFDYRQQLLTTSLSYIADHFFLGDLNFSTSGRFDLLLQGQGIIDITNLYLQIALNFGMIGFALYFFIFFRTIFGLALGAHSEMKQNERGSSPVVLAILFGWLALMATTSDVGLTTHLGFLFAALGRVAYGLSSEPKEIKHARDAGYRGPSRALARAGI